MTKFFLIGLACFLYFGTVQAQDLTNVDFSLRNLAGDEQSFQKYLQSLVGTGDTPQKGIVFISFWAMWCEPCKQEMKALVPLFEKWHGKNFRYLAINTDKPKSIAKVKAYIKTQEIPYDVWLDPNSEVFKKLNGHSMPYALIVTETGELLKKSVGFLAGDEEEVEKVISKYLE